jgi:hypothetical protein
MDPLTNIKRGSRPVKETEAEEEYCLKMFQIHNPPYFLKAGQGITVKQHDLEAIRSTFLKKETASNGEKEGKTCDS